MSLLANAKNQSLEEDYNATTSDGDVAAREKEKFTSEASYDFNDNDNDGYGATVSLPMSGRGEAGQNASERHSSENRWIRMLPFASLALVVIGAALGVILILSSRNSSDGQVDVATPVPSGSSTSLQPSFRPTTRLSTIKPSTFSPTLTPTKSNRTTSPSWRLPSARFPSQSPSEGLTPGPSPLPSASRSASPEPSEVPSTPPSESIVPTTSLAPSIEPSNTPSLEPTRYCFPQDVVEYTHVWQQNFTLQVKDSGNTICGPRDNRFSSSNVHLTTDRNETNDWVILRYSNQTASEVSILLPDQAYTYGTFSFSVRSVAVYNKNGTLLSQRLPDELVFGMFTYVDDVAFPHHEVDIEISTWNVTGDADVQFLITVLEEQESEQEKFRFYSGSKQSEYNQGGHWYNFTWDVDRVELGTSSGTPGENNYTITTGKAVQEGREDFIQCLPQVGLDVRVNLWSQFGTNAIEGLDETDVVEVVMDNFVYTPIDPVLLLQEGEICSKDCQCNGTLTCEESIQVCAFTNQSSGVPNIFE